MVALLALHFGFRQQDPKRMKRQRGLADSLKIDRSFVHPLKRNSDGSAVVSAIVQLGSTLRKTVVAEGIETADQVEQLRELGCGLGQGFHLSTPLSEEAAGAWMVACRVPRAFALSAAGGRAQTQADGSGRALYTGSRLLFLTSSITA